MLCQNEFDPLPKQQKVASHHFFAMHIEGAICCGGTYQPEIVWVTNSTEKSLKDKRIFSPGPSIISTQHLKKTSYLILL